MTQVELMIGILCGILLRSILFEGFFYLLRTVFQRKPQDVYERMIEEILLISPLDPITDSENTSLLEQLNYPRDLFTGEDILEHHPLVLELWVKQIRKENPLLDPDHLVTRGQRLVELQRIFSNNDPNSFLVVVSGSDVRYLVSLLGYHCPIPQFKLLLFGLYNFLGVFGW